MGNMTNSNKRFIFRKNKYSVLTILVIVLIAGIGVYMLAGSRAAGPFVSSEVESGSISAPAAVISDSTASGGQAIAFRNTPVGNVCASTIAFTPDGPDPWGGCWPGPTTTGVPDSTTLTTYTGSCTITTANTTIDSRTVNCVPLTIRASNVTITKSRLSGGINIESAYCGSASFVITDSHVDIPPVTSGGNSGDTGIMRCNFQANRVDVTGGRRSMYCVRNCVIENSWVHEHGVDPEAEAHFSGIRMEQNTTVRHSSITCEATRSGPGSGCSAGLTGYPDFAPVRDNLIERNLFYRGAAGGSTMCAYGGATGGKPYSGDATNATNIRFISNRFVRGTNGHCGNLGTILHFDPSRPGNVWTDNLFDTGAIVNATGP